MKLIDTTCPKCGANLRVDADMQSAFCEYCGAELLIDDEVQHLQIDNAESAGYAFEKGRQRAQQEAQMPMEYSAPLAPKKNKKMVWWVLGWIFIFPIPLTIIISRNQKLKTGVYYKEQRKGDSTMKQVTKDMNIREMVMMDEGIAEILMGAGMHCLGCMMSHFENLEQACAVHGIDADALVDQINEYLEAQGE